MYCNPRYFITPFKWLRCQVPSTIEVIQFFGYSSYTTWKLSVKGSFALALSGQHSYSILFLIAIFPLLGLRPFVLQLTTMVHVETIQLDFSNIYSLHTVQRCNKHIYYNHPIFHKKTSWQNLLLRRGGKKHRRAKYKNPHSCTMRAQPLPSPRHRVAGASLLPHLVRTPTASPPPQQYARRGSTYASGDRRSRFLADQSILPPSLVM